MFSRRLMSGCGKPRIAASAAPAIHHDELLPGSGEIDQLLPGVRIVNDGPYRYRDFDGFAVSSCAVASLAMAASLCGVLRVEAEV
jgi:hypothetical protein